MVIVLAITSVQVVLIFRLVPPHETSAWGKYSAPPKVDVPPPLMLTAILLGFAFSACSSIRTLFRAEEKVLVGEAERLTVPLLMVRFEVVPSNTRVTPSVLVQVGQETV